ncbi:hypothetical protein OK016_00790 [Vibrio chagasii]|nr:hypothetical protein [Vibrio chagasii]
MFQEVDEKRFAHELEPVKIVLVGQQVRVNHRLSMLSKGNGCRVDVLPSTGQLYGLQHAFVDDNDVRVVDLQGLDGNAKTEAVMLKR